MVYFTAFNSDLVSDDVVPTSFDDLVDPKFEGKIMATDYLGPWQALRYGRFDGEIEATKAYFEKLRDNGLQIFTGSSPQAAELLASGQRPIYAWANDVDIADLSSAGAPVGKVTDEAVVALYLSGCVVDAPHPAGAKLWNQWILSEAGQQAQANVGMALVHPTVQGSIDVSQIKTPYYVRPEYAADTDADLAAYNTIFGLS